MKESIEFLKQLLNKNDRIVIGLSGGPDSMCLFHLLTTLKKEYNLEIICAHLNHGLRQESEEEKFFVEKICEQENCIFEYKKLELTNKNVEQDARKKRYEFFEEIIKKYQAKYLMTAHHGDDLIETILMRLTRGSSIEGYSGFKQITKKDSYTLVRPLITATKEEIEKYIEEHKIEYRIDKTNNSDNYTRNRYRHHILPVLKSENKNVHKKFLKFSQELDLINQYLEKNTTIALTSVYEFGKVNLHKFKELDLIMQHRVLEYILKKEYQDNINLINERHLKLLMNLCMSNSPNKKINLPLKKVVVKNYDILQFSYNNKIECQEYILEDSIELNEGESIYKIEETNIEKSNYILRLDSKEIAFPLKVRNRRVSDKIHIKNMKFPKKVKDIFINEKVPLEKRDTWPIVVDANDNIIWIPGLKKSKFDKNINEFYDIIYKYVISEEKQNEKK